MKTQLGGNFLDQNKHIRISDIVLVFGFLVIIIGSNHTRRHGSVARLNLHSSYTSELHANGKVRPLEDGHG